jgi:hypothetical protein
MELSDFSEAFEAWYFGEAGGLFLSDKARDAYHSMLEVMATVAGEGSKEDQLTDEDTERLWRGGQALRRRLAAISERQKTLGWQGDCQPYRPRPLSD